MFQWRGDHFSLGSNSILIPWLSHYLVIGLLRGAPPCAGCLQSFLCCKVPRKCQLGRKAFWDFLKLWKVQDEYRAFFCSVALVWIVAWALDQAEVQLRKICTSPIPNNRSRQSTTMLAIKARIEYNTITLWYIFLTFINWNHFQLESLTIHPTV